MVVGFTSSEVLLVLLLEIDDHCVVAAVLPSVIFLFDLLSDVTVEHLDAEGDKLPLDLLLHVMAGVSCDVGVHEGADVADCEDALLSLK